MEMSRKPLRNRSSRHDSHARIPVHTHQHHRSKPAVTISERLHKLRQSALCRAAFLYPDHTKKRSQGRPCNRYHAPDARDSAAPGSQRPLAVSRSQRLRPRRCNLQYGKGLRAPPPLRDCRRDRNKHSCSNGWVHKVLAGFRCGGARKMGTGTRPTQTGFATAWGQAGREPVPIFLSWLRPRGSRSLFGYCLLEGRFESSGGPRTRAPDVARFCDE